MSKFANHFLKVLPLFLFSLVFQPLTNFCSAAEIKGVVDLKRQDADSKKWVSAGDNSGVVVYLTGLKGGVSQRKSKPQIVQKEKEFFPRVLPVVQGESVNFKNEDSIHHNVWSLSKAKSFDLGTFKAPHSKEVNFDKPGLVKVFCDIHPEMIASVLVLKNGYFATTGKDGSYSIKGVPPGTYKLRAWAEGVKPTRVSVTIGKAKSYTHNLEVHSKLRSTNHLNKNGKPYKKY